MTKYILCVISSSSFFSGNANAKMTIAIGFEVLNLACEMFTAVSMLPYYALQCNGGGERWGDEGAEPSSKQLCLRLKHEMARKTDIWSRERKGGRLWALLVGP